MVYRISSFMPWSLEETASCGAGDCTWNGMDVQRLGSLHLVAHQLMGEGLVVGVHVSAPSNGVWFRRL